MKVGGEMGLMVLMARSGVDSSRGAPGASIAAQAS
jgi:hypothetical protein